MVAVEFVVMSPVLPRVLGSLGPRLVVAAVAGSEASVTAAWRMWTVIRFKQMFVFGLEFAPNGYFLKPISGPIEKGEYLME